MKQSEKALGDHLYAKLIAFNANEHELPGISDPHNCAAFIDQLVDSIRRVRYLSVMRSRPISIDRSDPCSALFDPLKAAELYRREGNLDEACWLVFLATHFGKSLSTGWRLPRDVYGGLQQGVIWDWNTVSNNTSDFESWIEKVYLTLAGADGVMRRFGNHRKYETLKPNKPKSPGKVISTYIEWTGPTKMHIDLFQEAKRKTDADPRSVFRYLYRSMSSVASFGRTGRFDYLTMLGKMGLVSVEADSAYMHGATGPKSGGFLLFNGSKNIPVGTQELDALFLKLGEYLQVGQQAMQVMEDAICNWQKNPAKFVRFNG